MIAVGKDYGRCADLPVLIGHCHYPLLRFSLQIRRLETTFPKIPSVHGSWLEWAKERDSMIWKSRKKGQGNMRVVHKV